MKNSLIVISFSLLLHFAQGQRYFQHRFNLTDTTLRNERFNSGIRTINNFDATSAYYYAGIGTSYINASHDSLTNKANRLRFTRMNASGNTVLSNYGYHFLRDGKELHSIGNSIAEIGNTAGNGGYVAVGAVTDNAITGAVADGGSDVLFTRLTASGAVSWARRIDLGKGKDMAWYIKRSNVTVAGQPTWLICGESRQSSAYTDCFVARVDINGTVIWCRRLNFDPGGFPFTSAHCIAKQLCEDAAGCIYVVGTLQDSQAGANGIDGLAFKLTPNGAVLWGNNYHRATDDEFQAVRLVPDGNLIVGGFTNEGGTYNMQITKLSAAAGNIMFQNILRAATAAQVFPSKCYDIVVVPGQGYYLAGVLIQNNVYREMMYAAGAGGAGLRWNSYNAMQYNVGFGIDYVPGDNCPGIAYFSSLKDPLNAAFSDGHIMKTDLFSRTCNFLEPKQPVNMDSHLGKYPRYWQYRDTVSGSSLKSSIFKYVNRQICYVGCINPPVVAVAPEDVSLTSGTALTGGLKISPNPVHNKMHLEFNLPQAGEYQVEVIDMRGGLVQKRKQLFNIGTSKTDLDMSVLSPGVYLLRLRQGTFVLQQKVVKE